MNNRRASEDSAQSLLARLSDGIDAYRARIATMERLKDRKRDYLAEVERFVEVINPRLFSTIRSLDEMLRAKSFGTARIDFDSDQSELFRTLDPASSDWSIKRFTIIKAHVEIIIGDTQHLSVKGDVTFFFRRGRIDWDNGASEWFYSEMDIVRDNPKYGPKDSIDSMWLAFALFRGRPDHQGICEVDPIEIIERRLFGA